MPRVSLEAETSIDGSTLQTLLLSDAADEDAADEEIISQLLSTNEGSNRRRRRCCNFLRGSSGMLLFVLFTLLGVFASTWATCSCDVVAMRWNEGGLELSITGVGFWSYQQEVADPKHKSNYITGEGSEIAMKEVCMDYGSKVKHPQASMDDYFPSNQTLQMYSILAPSFYFMAIIAMFVFAIINSLHPGALSQSENQNCPVKGMAVSAITAAVFLILSAIFQILSVHGLMHNSNNNLDDEQSKSPICNPAYSHCVLGSGGKWAAFAVFSAFACGLMSCSAAYFVGFKTGRRRRCFWK